MPDAEGLLARSEELARTLSRMARQGNRILIVTHIDADGLASGSIMFEALARKGASVSVRAIPDIDPKIVRELRAEGFDMLIFTDLASGLLSDLSATGEPFLVIDHHQIPERERTNLNLFNAWSFGFDGGREACSSTMAYILATALDDSNKDLSDLSIVGAVGDRQDSGPGRSLYGLNIRTLEEAVDAGLIKVSKDFLLHGRETRPVHEALAQSYTPLIPGLSGSKDSALAALSNSGLKLKERGRWRTLTELTSQEKQILLDVIARHAGSSENGSAIISDLIGEVYTLNGEDSFLPLRDAREFATLLNACGRMDKADVGISICLGDREFRLAEGLKTAAEYRGKIAKLIEVLGPGDDKVVTNGDLALVVGDEFVEERLTGSVSSILASAPRFRGKVVLVRARSGDSDLKFSTRIGEGYSKSVNLGLVMSEAAEMVGGVGGGHSMAAGAKIPWSRGDEFARIVLQKVSG